MPELRKDPVTGRWVIIATDRAKRPSDFIRQPVTPLSHGICPFCPGNESKTPPEVLAYRNSGGRDQPGWRVRVVPNKFPVLGIEGDLNRQGEGMYDKMNGIGAHEVIVETPEHATNLGEMPERQIEEVLWAFKERVNDLKKDRRFRYILLFKNHGEAAGASLEHPHSQLIALPVIPKRVKEEVDAAKDFYDWKERCIFCDIIRQETTAGVRMVTETDRFTVLEPYAPRFPFETWILPNRHGSHFEDSDAPTLQALAFVLRSTIRKIDKVLESQPITSSCTARPSRIHRWNIITGISRSFRNSRRWPASNGERDFISTRHRRKSRRDSCGKQDSDDRVARSRRGLV